MSADPAIRPMTSTNPTLRVDVADLLTHPAARRPVRFSANVAGLAGSAAAVPDDEPVGLDLVLERVPDGIVVRGDDHRPLARGVQHLPAGPHLDDRRLHVDELFEPEPVEGDTYPLPDTSSTSNSSSGTPCCSSSRSPRRVQRAGAGACGDDVPQPDDAPAPDPRWHALSELEL